MEKLTWLTFWLLSFARLADAQEAPPCADLSLGYSYLREGFSGAANTHGGSASGTAYLNDWRGVPGDFGTHHLSQSGFSTYTYTSLGGPRLSANRGKGVSPFVQALVGGDRFTASGESVHGFSWSAGGGGDLVVSRHIAFRPQFEYIGLRFANGTTDCARASFSVRFSFQRPLENPEMIA